MTYFNKLAQCVNIKGFQQSISLIAYDICSTCTEPTLFVSTPDTDNYYAASMHLKYRNREYILHHDSEPAYTLHRNGTYYYFFNEGVTCRIEDLPCDDETKCMLVLKYSRLNDHAYVYL